MKNYKMYLWITAVVLISGLFVFSSCDKDDPTSESKVAVAGVKLNKSSVTLEVGAKETLSVTVLPENATDKGVSWKSSAEAIATVSESGEVTAVSKGSATITVTTKDGNKTATCTVSVKEKNTTVAVSAIKFDKTTITLEVGAKETLSVTVLPENATDKEISWKSSAEAIATVSESGEVTAVSKGSATITVTTKDGNKTATCAVNVSEKDKPQDAIEVFISGTISHTTFTKGQSGTVTFNRFPANEDEFKQVREKIGGEPHGAVALQLMAYEMYRRNKDVGTKCITLNNTTNNVTPAIDRLKELFGNDAYYARPYQIAAFLKGATPENGYNPTKPYTIEVKVNDGREYQYSSDYQATVLYLDVLTKGKDQGTETLYVLKTKRPGEQGEGKYFIINNSPGLYSQVKEASFENPFKGLD